MRLGLSGKGAMANQLTVRRVSMHWKKSADPGLRQGRGGAWDHRRCGPCPLPNPPNLYP